MQVRNLELAQDIVQEAFARVWASARTPKPEPEFKRWLYRAITNLAIMGGTLLALGVEVIFSAFFLSILKASRERRWA